MTPSPFRTVWVAFGKLKDQLEIDGTPEAFERLRQLAEEIDAAERNWISVSSGFGSRDPGPQTELQTTEP